jgi:hypothetical protein
LLGRIAPTLVPGSRWPNEDGMVEALVGVGLFRSATGHATQSEGVLGALGYWRSRDGREIDFTVPAGTLDDRAGRVPVEVKGDSAAEIKAAASSIRQSFGRGIIATREVFDVEGDVLRIPAAVLLATLRECTERRLSTL